MFNPVLDLLNSLRLEATDKKIQSPSLDFDHPIDDSLNGFGPEQESVRVFVAPDV